VLSFVRRHREPLLVCILLAHALGMFLGSSRRVREPNVIDRVALAMTAPVQRAAVASIDGVVNAWQQYVSLRSVRREVGQLQAENAQLRGDVVGLAEARAENERLRRLIHYEEGNPGPKVVARVLGINPDPNRLTLRIDRGEGDGVRRGQAVVTADGVVGQVLRATASAADVLVAFDPNCRLGGRIQRTRARVGVSGAGENQALKLEYLLRSEDLEEGDLVVTSGTDGVYPPGLVVGRVTGVQRQTSGMFLNAGILPAVNFTRVEEVVVLAPQPAALVPTRVESLGRR
jgi:rod shape-determining protein MreC